MALSIGATAPAFTLKSKTNDGLIDINLADWLGKKNIVLLFFPLAFTGVCQEELCTVSAGLQAYTDLNAEVFGISVDSPFAQEGWAKANSIEIRLLSDFNKTVAQQYGVLYEELLGFKGVAKRSAFVVNKAGEIAYSWVTEDPHNLPDFNAIQAVLKNL